MAGRSFLDPSAQEFHPNFAFTIPHIYSSYPSPTPSPRPPSAVHPSHASSDSPTRSVLLSLLPPHATESLLCSSMQLFGGVRAVDMGLDTATATVHFFDLRSAQAAVAEVQNQHMRRQHQQVCLLLMGPHDVGRGLVGGHAVWAQFGRRSLDSPNQGSLFVFASDPVSADQVRDIFQVFGSVMEVRETPSNPHKKFVEFFDVRDAARALEELNSKEVLGVRLLIEFSRPGGVQARFQRRTNYSGHRNLPVPPRFRGSSSSQSSSSSTDRGGRSRSKIGDKSIMLLKRGDAIRKGNSCNSPPPSSSKKQQQQQQSSNRKRSKNFPKNPGGDSSFLFEEVEPALIKSESSSSSSCSTSGSSRDFRTTVMIKNIPNKYSQKLLLNMLDNHCIHCNEKVQQNGLSAYDFVYLPIDFSNKCNMGYGFVNMTSPEATVKLYRAFHNQPWEVFNSRKICQVTYARLQGLEALKEHFKKSKFPCDNDEYMPVVFSPPRDGVQLTVPLPIGGICGSSSFRSHTIVSTTADLSGTVSSTTTSTHAKSDDQADDDDGRDEADGGLCEQFLKLSYTAEG